MGIFSSLFGRSQDDPEELQTSDPAGPLPELYNGMTLDLETTEGTRVLTGRLTGYTAGDTTLTLERLPGGLSFEVRELGSELVIRGVNETLIQFCLRGTVQESTRLICRLKDVRVKIVNEQRANFRLLLNIPASLYNSADTALSNPEACTLVDIGTGGACVESEYLHAEDEVLRLKVKLLDYAPMDFLGEIIRVTEYEPGKFRYGFLFAQLKESELTELTRTLYNLQVGNRTPWIRSPEGHW